MERISRSSQVGEWLDFAGLRMALLTLSGDALDLTLGRFAA